MKLACDRCGKTLLLDENVRYKVRIEVYAAYDPMEISADDLARDHQEEIRRLLEKAEDMSPEEAQDSVYRQMEFDICPRCQRKYLRDPLGVEADTTPPQGGQSSLDKEP